MLLYVFHHCLYLQLFRLVSLFLALFPGSRPPLRFFLIQTPLNLIQITGTAERQRFSCIFEIRIPADQQYLRLEAAVPDRLQQGEAVHSGHTDIGNNQIRVGSVNPRQGLFPILRLAADSKAVITPRYHIFKCQQSPWLIIRQKHMVHIIFLPPVKPSLFPYLPLLCFLR